MNFWFLAFEPDGKQKSINREHESADRLQKNVAVGNSSTPSFHTEYWCLIPGLYIFSSARFITITQSF